MPSGSVETFLRSLSASPLLTVQQQEELVQSCRGKTVDARSLAKDLLQRGWLTPYQVNQVFQGRSAELVMGPYLVLERLGEGGTGQVFKARHLRMERIVALKLIRAALLSDPEIVGRFYREVQVLSRLSHPNVVHAYDAGPLGSTHFLVMEYVEGTDLAQWVQKHGPLPTAEACHYIRQAALGLQHAHEKGLVHRDVKPSNLLRSNTGQIKVLDLGLARLHKADGELTQNLTPVGAGAATMGTPDYLAPEQALDFHQVDIRADIYGLGCTLFFLLAGQAPFAGGSMAQKLMRHMQLDPPPLAGFRADASPELEAVVRRMMAKRPEKRFQTPLEVADALTGLASGAVSLPVLGAISESPMPRRLKRTQWIGAGALVVVVLVLGSIWLSRGKDPPKTEAQAAVETARSSTASALRPTRVVELQGRSIVRDVLLDPLRPSEALGGEQRNNPLHKRETQCGAFLVRFDVGRLANSGNRVERADVAFWVWDTSGKVNTKVGAFAVRTPWEEMAATWQQPMKGKSWQGGKHFAFGIDTGPPAAYVLVSPGDGMELNPPLEYHIDATAVTQAWLDGAVNNGLALAPVNDRTIDEGWQARFQVYASEHPRTAHTPKLTITLK
jgi:serine/threonine protein kinase